MLGAAARKKIDSTTSTSFACDLRKWLQIMEAYEQGGFAYHATMPTDALTVLRNVMAETEAYGFRSEEHTSELQSLMRISYAVLCLKNKQTYTYKTTNYA